jgi:hypothetical protein
VKLDFVIVTTARTGSSHLVSLIDSHPEACCYLELFNPEAIGPTFQNSSHDDPLVYLDEFTEAVEERVVGMKVPWGGLVEVPEQLGLFREPDLRVIHLLRRDKVQQYVSMQLAHATGIYHSWEGLQPEHRMLLDALDYFAWVKNTVFADAVLAQLAAGHPNLTVEYEDLDRVETHQAVLELLGLPVRELSSELVRVSAPRSHLADVIANWDDFVKAVRQSPAAWTLESNAARQT